MIGGGLEGQIERHLEPVVPGCRNERLEVRHGPQVRVDRVVAALDGADRPRRAGIVGARFE